MDQSHNYYQLCHILFLNTEMIDEISDSVNEKYMELYYLLMSENDVL